MVTASYHMPRALTELAQAMPDVTLLPVPVMPPGMQGPAGMGDVAKIRLMATEYTKWLAATLRLTGLAPREGSPSRTAPMSAAG